MLQHSSQRDSTDAILNGSVDDDNRHYYYKQGYDFGISLYAELMVNNDFFKEKRKSKLNKQVDKHKLISLSIWGFQGAICEGPEPIPELKNIKKSYYLDTHIYK